MIALRQLDVRRRGRWFGHVVQLGALVGATLLHLLVGACGERAVVSAQGPSNAAPTPSSAPVPNAGPPPNSASASPESSSALPGVADFARALDGVWCWARPQKANGSLERHTVTFSQDGRRMKVEYIEAAARGSAEPAAEYVVDAIDKRRARMRMVGEKRTTDAGALVAWDLVLVEPDVYCWHRTDWKEHACSDKVTRCPPPAKYGMECPDQPPPQTIEASIVLVQWAQSFHVLPGITRTKAEALARAKSCLDEIRAGTPFGTVVEHCSDEPGAAPRAGMLGKIKREDMLRAFSDVAFSLCVGEVSDPVETVLGYTVIFRTK